MFTACIVALAGALPFVKSLVTFGVLCFSIVFFLCCVAGFVVARWAGMFIFLVYIGGLIVMFGYFLAICPNQKVRFRRWRRVVIGGVVVLGVLCVRGRLPMSVEFYNRSGMDVMFTKAGFPLLSFLAFTLFLTLVVVVKVVEARKGPLRPFKIRGRKEDVDDD